MMIELSSSSTNLISKWRADHLKAEVKLFNQLLSLFRLPEVSIFLSLQPLNRYGMIFHNIHEWAVNGEDLKEFLRNLIQVCAGKGMTIPVLSLAMREFIAIRELGMIQKSPPIKLNIYLRSRHFSI
ncbi:hypothetical protein RF11_10594 [Thelohanellus kitauei]|uniref:Uncharacterized protein n=1 Tax=Thelohanellus kitauei TaxID=669202 RepID=A0A0C2JYD6_THEKT|nr:hypothetical protein RF11_10594 [Thelohanellus kitauei]